jgi:thimet oligopeptidase
MTPPQQSPGLCAKTSRMRSILTLIPAVALLAAACSGSTATTRTEGPVPDQTQPDQTQPETGPQPRPQSLEEVFARECLVGLERAQALLPRILAEPGPRTLENTLEPYNELLMHVEASGGTAGLMYSVHPSEKLREAARGCEQKVDAFLSELRLDRRLYEAIAGLDTADFDADTRRWVEHTLRDFRRAGVDRDDATRKRLKEIDEEMTRLGQQFSKNIVDDVRRIRVSSDQLAGLPDDFIAARKPGPDGKLEITTDNPDYMPFMAYADDDELRRQLYVAFRARAGEQNEPVLHRILVLRQEKAKLLGYANWADYATEDKMMKSAAKAAEFIERIVKVADKRAKKDYAELLARKRKLDPRAKLVEDWQKTYLENKVKAEKYAFDVQSVRPYFPYAQVQQGLLDLTAEIYDVRYVPVEDDPLRWHEDVTIYDVERGGTKLGRIYLDMHPREGKYKHAAQFPYRNGVAGKQLPIGVLVCNFPNPRTGPALMEHRDVVTMFHEFGHLMHHVFGGHQRWIAQSGVATEWDFVEAPSQMFEEWAWNHEVLARFARHHETGAVIPAEKVERMRRADKFGLGVQTVQQMFYASISLGFHTKDPAELTDMNAEVARLQARYTPFRFVDGTRFHANFGHLYNYSAIYYTYMWSLVIAKDLLTPFEKHGLMNTAWTYRYRDRVLAPGGTRDAADLVKDFLGRPYDFKAFEKYLGG